MVRFNLTRLEPQQQPQNRYHIMDCIFVTLGHSCKDLGEGLQLA